MQTFRKRTLGSLAALAFRTPIELLLLSLLLGTIVRVIPSRGDRGIAT